MFDNPKIIRYEMDGQEIKLTVHRATALMGMKRSVLKIRAAKDHNDQDDAVGILRLITYPDLISCTTDVVGIENAISFDVFCNLPDALILEWERAVYELNPHWNPVNISDEEQEKKA